MNLAVERIEFLDTDDWWEFRTFLSVRLERQYRELAQQIVDSDEPQTPGEFVCAVDALVVAVTTGWSYGPLDVDTLLNVVPSHHYSQVAMRMADLYNPKVIENIKRLQQSFLLHSSNGDQSHQPSTTPI